MDTQKRPEIQASSRKDTKNHKVHRFGDFSQNDSIIQACKLIIKGQIDFIQQMTPVAKEGTDNEGVHKLRVGYRRIRTCLQVLKPFIKKKSYKYFRNNAKEIGQVLGNIRDLDVFIGNIQSTYNQTTDQDDKSDDLIEGLGLSNIYLDHKSKFLYYLTSPKYLEFLREFEIFYTNERAGLKKKITVGENHSKIKNHLPQKLYELFAKIESYGPKFQILQPYTIYHEFRIDAKKFRYTLEFFSSVYNIPPYETLVKELVLIQDQLGILNDCVVASKLLENHLKNEKLTQKSNIVNKITNYINYRKSEKNNLIKKMPDLWGNFQSANPSMLLEQSLAPLKD